MKNNETINKAFAELGFKTNDEIEALNHKIRKMHATLIAAGEVTMLDIIKEIEQFQIPEGQKILVAMMYQKKLDAQRFRKKLLDNMFQGEF